MVPSGKNIQLICNSTAAPGNSPTMKVSVNIWPASEWIPYLEKQVGRRLDSLLEQNTQRPVLLLEVENSGSQLQTFLSQILRVSTSSSSSSTCVNCLINLTMKDVTVVMCYSIKKMLLVNCFHGNKTNLLGEQSLHNLIGNLKQTEKEKEECDHWM